MLYFSGCRFLGSGFRDNKWILLISFGCTNVDFVVTSGFRGFRYLGRPPDNATRTLKCDQFYRSNTKYLSHQPDRYNKLTQQPI